MAFSWEPLYITEASETLNSPLEKYNKINTVKDTLLIPSAIPSAVSRESNF